MRLAAKMSMIAEWCASSASQAAKMKDWEDLKVDLAQDRGLVASGPGTAGVLLLPRTIAGAGLTTFPPKETRQSPYLSS